MKTMLTAITLFALSFGAVDAAPSEKTKVSFKTSDNVAISAYFVEGSSEAEKKPVVILLHGYKGSKENWDSILDSYFLENSSFSYLAIDLRGHGHSTKKGDETISYENFDEAEFMDMLLDVGAAVSYLRAREDVDADRIALVGATLSANLAILYASKDARIKGVAMISPGIEILGVKCDWAVSDYGKLESTRPLFLGVSRDDGASLSSVKVLATYGISRKSVRTYGGNLRGTEMLGKVPIEKDIVEFLDICLKQTSPEETASAIQPSS